MLAFVRAFVRVCGCTSGIVCSGAETFSSATSLSRVIAALVAVAFVLEEGEGLTGRRSPASSSSLLSSKYRKSSLNISLNRDARRRFHDLVGDEERRLTPILRLLVGTGVAVGDVCDTDALTSPSGFSGSRFDFLTSRSGLPHEELSSFTTKNK